MKIYIQPQIISIDLDPYDMIAISGDLLEKVNDTSTPASHTIEILSRERDLPEDESTDFSW